MKKTLKKSDKAKQDLLIIDGIICRPKSHYSYHDISSEYRPSGSLLLWRKEKVYTVEIHWKDGATTSRTFMGETEDNKKRAEKLFNSITAQL